MQTVNRIVLQHVHPDLINVIADFRIRRAGIDTFQLTSIRLGPFNDLLTVDRIARRHVVQLSRNRLRNREPFGMLVVDVVWMSG